jgi:BirA family biotin operon repressor/biotin-[acetyl-CoA-carboxylase] ligase
MIRTPFVARYERFDVVGSTNDVVREWLAEGNPEVCLAVADEQTAGRGREGRTWTAPAGRALLLSLGFRPTWLQPDRAWRLAAATSLAMADAAEQVAGLASGTIRLKWPNDLVVASSGEWLAGASPSPSEGSEANRRSDVRKLAGVLGETVGLGSDDPRAVVGIGVNSDWPATEFPADIAATMTSLREVAGGRPIDHILLLDTFKVHVEGRIEALRAGQFSDGDWVDRQLTDGRLVRIEHHDGRSEMVRAVRADPDGGGLVIEDPTADIGERTIVSGEIRHLRVRETV